MDSFEELGVAPELVEALAAGGIERPTPLQEDAVPVLRRGNNLVLTAGPGAGTLVAWAVPLLERIEPEGHAPLILALTPTAQAADRLAESMGRMAAATGHSVAAVGSPWVFPGRAHVLFGTPEDVLALAEAGTASLTDVRSVVLDQANLTQRLVGLEPVEQALDYVPKDAQRVVAALPLTDEVSDFVERHVLRAVMIPGRAADPDASAPSSPHRGSVRFRVAVDAPEAATLATVAELLDGGARHVLVYCRSDDRAADVGDYLTLRGYAAGAPGDDDAPVWLGVDALAAREAMEGSEPPVVVSCDVPSDPDVLDRRHGVSDEGVVIVLPRELPHLRDVARRTGYKLRPLPLPSADGGGEVARLRETLVQALDEEDIAPYLVALEPLFESHDPAEVAAAAVALLRKKAPTTPRPSGSAPAGAHREAETPSWTKLFMSVGERDGAGPGDLLGAITGESGAGGDQVGRIDIHESHTVVEVHSGVARRVIKALNGTTLKGRAMRVDYDRPHGGGGRKGGGRSRR